MLFLVLYGVLLASHISCVARSASHSPPNNRTTAISLGNLHFMRVPISSKHTTTLLQDIDSKYASSAVSIQATAGSDSALSLVSAVAAEYERADFFAPVLSVLEHPDRTRVNGSAVERKLVDAAVGGALRNRRSVELGEQRGRLVDSESWEISGRSPARPQHVSVELRLNVSNTLCSENDASQLGAASRWLERGARSVEGVHGGVFNTQPKSWDSFKSSVSVFDVNRFDAVRAVQGLEGNDAPAGAMAASESRARFVLA